MSSRATAGHRPRLSPRTAVLGAVILVLAATGIVPAKAYLSQRGRIDDLHERIQILQQERARLHRRIGGLNDPKQLERLARECLGMVRPGEISFVGVPQGGGTLPSDC